MSDIAIRLLSAAMDRTPVAAGRSQAPAKKIDAPKTDVIDLSKPLTPEEAERMRSAGFLGYGSVSATKTVTTETLGNGASATHVTLEYRHEYCDVTSGVAYHSAYSSVNVDTYTSGGFAFTGVTTQMGCTWNDGSYWEATLHECAFSLEMGGHSSYYIPQHLNEDGSWSLAEYGPSARFTVSGYHSIFSAAYSSGGQTQYFWSETFAGQARGMIPGGPIPNGAEKLPPPSGQDLLDRLDRLADHLRRGFNARA